MRYKLIFLFIIYPLAIFPQLKISGTVVDRGNQEPVAYAVVYTDEKITMTDETGKYEIDVKPHEQVYFRQLAYDFFSMSSDSLVNNQKIYLNPHIVELNEAIILPENAQKLLERSIHNLNTRFQKNKTNPYLFHVEGTTSIGGEREAYALVDATLAKINKNGEQSWNFDLIQLDKIKNINKEGFYLRKKPLGIDIFPDKGVAVDFEKFIFNIQENNDNQIIINASPKYPDKKRHSYVLFTINKQDTVLTEYTTQSLPDIVNITTQKFLGIYRQIISHYSTVKYEQDKLTGSYFYKGGQHIVKVKIYADSTYYLTGKATDFIISNPINRSQEKKKIKPRDYVLFETDFPNTPGFWKQYAKP